MGCIQRRRVAIFQFVDAGSPLFQDACKRHAAFRSTYHGELSCFPVNTVEYLSNFDQLYGLIFIGSSTAFSAMISAAIILLQSSCVIPQAILLYRGRDRVLPERYFNLGRLGPVINATSVAWVVFLNVIYCIPTTMPATPQNMSYVSVVCVGLIGFVVVLWFTTKKGVFKGPQIDLELLRERREAAINGLEIVQVDSERRISRTSTSKYIKETVAST
jgi:choline transport protein